MPDVCPKCLLKLWRRHNRGAPGLATIWREQADIHMANGEGERALEALWYAYEAEHLEASKDCDHIGR